MEGKYPLFVELRLIYLEIVDLQRFSLLAIWVIE